MQTPNWQQEAQRALSLVGDRLIEAHRGAFVWHHPTQTVLIFANDGTPAKYGPYLEYVCQREMIDVLATAQDDYSFVMLCKVDEDYIDETTNGLVDEVWNAWKHEALSTEKIQRRVAAERIERFVTGLEHPWELTDGRN